MLETENRKKAKTAKRDISTNERIATIVKDIIPESSHENIFIKNPELEKILKIFYANTEVHTIILNISDPLTLSILKKIISEKNEMYSNSVSSPLIEDFKALIRKSVYFQFRRNVLTYEGEIISLNNGILTLSTLKERKEIQLTKELFQLAKEFSIGDVVYIEPNGCLIRRLGRSENKLSEYDLEADKYISIGKTPVAQFKERISVVSLSDLDKAYSKDSTPISQKTIEEMILSYYQEGVLEPRKSILFIEEGNLLPKNKLKYLLSYAQRYPCLKTIVCGFFPSDISMPGVLYVPNIEHEDPLSHLTREFQEKLSIPEFLSETKSYLGFIEYSILRSLIQASENISEFKEFCLLTITIQKE